MENKLLLFAVEETNLCTAKDLFAAFCIRTSTTINVGFGHP